MTKEQLLEKLKELHVHQKFYSINNEHKEYAYHVEDLYNGKYAPYLLERGAKEG